MRSPSQHSLSETNFGLRKGFQLGCWTFGCGSKLNRRGKPQVLVHISTYQGSVLVPVFGATATWGGGSDHFPHGGQALEDCKLAEEKRPEPRGVSHRLARWGPRSGSSNGPKRVKVSTGILSCLGSHLLWVPGARNMYTGVVASVCLSSSLRVLPVLWMMVGKYIEHFALDDPQFETLLPPRLLDGPSCGVSLRFLKIFPC